MGKLNPDRCGKFVRVHLGAIIPGCHAPQWIGSIEIVDRGSGWSPEERATFDAALGDAQTQLDDAHALCAEWGYPKERCHVYVIIEKDVLFFEDEEGRVGQSYFALPSSSAWGKDEEWGKNQDPNEAFRGLLYSEGKPEKRWPSVRWGDAPVCPWLWYTP